MTGSWFLQRGRADPIGPFTYDEVARGLALGEIPDDVMVREVSEAAWRPIRGVPEFRSLVRRTSAEGDAERLAPVEGPAWVSRATRHVGRGGPGGGEASASEAPAPVASASKAKARPVAPYVVPDATHRRIATSIAALGVVWTLSRVALLVLAPVGWAQLVGAFALLRAAAIVEAALGAVLWPLLLVGVAASARRGWRGTPLVRSVALAAALAHGALAAVVVWLLSAAPGWAAEPSRVGLLATAVGAPVVLAVAAAWIFRLFPADPPTAPVPVVGLGAVALAAGLGWLAIATFPSVVRLSPLDARDDVVATFPDAVDLAAWLDGRREGVAGMPKVASALQRAVVIPRGARAHVVDDVALPTAHGPEIARLVELLDAQPGRRVYVPIGVTAPTAR